MTKFVRYQAVHAPDRYGRLDGDMITPLSGDFPTFTPDPDAATISICEVTLKAPVVPSKIVAVGPNYHAHLHGSPPPARPYYWTKPATVLLDPEGTIELPNLDVPICYEAEIAIVIARTAKCVSRAEAMDYVFGYTCINDVSAGNLVDLPEYIGSKYFVDGKVYDTFGPIGPCIETELDPSNVTVRCRVNGEQRTEHSTSDMIFPVDRLIELVSGVMTLFPGDIIATGTPPGFGVITPGDVIEVEVDGIGILRNRAMSRG